MTAEKDECRCKECAIIHQEFISHFNKWPSRTHEEGQELKRKREDNLRSWEEALQR